jgi:hypothetical protein
VLAALPASDVLRLRRGGQAPALMVTTHLTTETAKGESLGATGSRMDDKGRAKCAPAAPPLARWAGHRG